MAEEPKNQVKAVMNYIDSLPPAKVASDEKVGEKFVQVFNAIHGSKAGSSIYEAEKFYFQKLVSENEKLSKCTPMSLYGAFVTLAVEGLSLDPAKHLSYLMSRSCKVMKNGVATWEERAYLEVQALGE